MALLDSWQIKRHDYCSNSSDITQYIGRITREIGGNAKTKVYDYRDPKVEYLEKLSKKRQTYYRKNFEL